MEREGEGEQGGVEQDSGRLNGEGCGQDTHLDAFSDTRAVGFEGVELLFQFSASGQESGALFFHRLQSSLVTDSERGDGIEVAAVEKESTLDKVSLPCTLR
eukprot:TRINITY_DN382_c0_g1_i6.p1 TRINITY_DN382_c0_g1~~TRINITY_DN382_c0_g1_i6.p1  ORF type:complete len:101 (-),score=20.17 TRINITY_DN382_c0_g1_i6:19-321(-)